ncbi:MAG TPA: hypothetical protein VGM17_09540 [Rhizomicrobium sp.]|jgi:hypothetical protein
MVGFSRALQAAAAAGLMSLVAGATSASAQATYTDEQQIGRDRTAAVQCDAWGDRCAQVICRDSTGRCHTTGVAYYRPAYDGYYSTRMVCDRNEANCHYLAPGE